MWGKLKVWKFVAAAVLYVAVILGACLWAIENNRPNRRDMEEATAEGVSAGRLGQPPQACPYDGWARELWLKGWLKGDAERRANEPK